MGDDVVGSTLNQCCEAVPCPSGVYGWFDTFRIPTSPDTVSGGGVRILVVEEIPAKATATLENMQFFFLVKLRVTG